MSKPCLQATKHVGFIWHPHVSSLHSGSPVGGPRRESNIETPGPRASLGAQERDFNTYEFKKQHRNSPAHIWLMLAACNSRWNIPWDGEGAVLWSWEFWRACQRSRYSFLMISRFVCAQICPLCLGKPPGKHEIGGLTKRLFWSDHRKDNAGAICSVALPQKSSLSQRCLLPGPPHWAPGVSGALGVSFSGVFGDFAVLQREPSKARLGAGAFFLTHGLTWGETSWWVALPRPSYPCR